MIKLPYPIVIMSSPCSCVSVHLHRVGTSVGRLNQHLATKMLTMRLAMSEASEYWIWQIGIQLQCWEGKNKPWSPSWPTVFVFVKFIVFVEVKIQTLIPFLTSWRTCWGPRGARLSHTDWVSLVFVFLYFVFLYHEFYFVYFCIHTWTASSWLWLCGYKGEIVRL